MPDESEPNVRESVPFFNVTDLPASFAFYVDGLGFRITAKWEPEGRIRWCRLQHGGAGIMLQEFWSDGSHEPRPAGKLGLGVSVCFMCADALAIYRDARARGLDAGEPFVGNGLWVTSFTDPMAIDWISRARLMCPKRRSLANGRRGVDDQALKRVARRPDSPPSVYMNSDARSPKNVESHHSPLMKAC